MAATYDAETLAKVNFWRKYRDPDSMDYDMTALNKLYRGVKHTPPVFGAPGPGQPRVIIPEEDDEPQPFTQEDVLKQTFLAQTLTSLPINPAKWKGARFLGSGISARAGLWEWTGGPNDPIPGFTEVVIKELFVGKDYKATDALGNEKDFLTRCNTASSTHLLKMYQSTDDIKLGSDLGLGPEWDGLTRRLFLEYCDVGSMQQLLKKRIKEEKYFKEKTLWLIFNCLVDGLTALEHGAEYQTDYSTGQAQQYLAGPPDGWESIIHFDVKPDNIFMARDAYHAFTPTFKFADFGLSVFDYKQIGFSGANGETYRTYGTEDYFTPEQFTERWDFSDYQDSPVAGCYSFYTNIWGVGNIMWQFAMLSSDPVDHKQPFLPDWNPLLGSPTYGLDLRACPYSQAFADLVFACLSEEPGFRPPLDELKASIAAGFAAANLMEQEFEPYDDLCPAGPVPAPTQASIPAAVPAAAPPTARTSSQLPRLSHLRL